MRSKSVIRAAFAACLASAFASVLFISGGAADAISEPAPPKISRNYPAPTGTHLTLINGNGNIRITSWEKRQIFVKADSMHPVTLDDRNSGPDLTLHVKRPRMERVNLDVNAPSDTSLSVRNLVGSVDISGFTGHLKIDSADGDIHLIAIKSPSIDVKVIRGDIYFDGELNGGGPYSLQSMRGDIDVTLPQGAAFDLAARALTDDNIVIGSFFLSPKSEAPKSISGKHEGGGPRLSLTCYDGRIFMHKK